LHKIYIQMKRSIFTIPFVLLILLSCSEIETPRSVVEEELILQYIEDKGLEAIKHSTGLYYVINDPGIGDEYPYVDRTTGNSSLVKVEYTGYFMNDTVFDSGLWDFYPLGTAIQGWHYGLSMLKIGGSAKLILPSNLGYGSINVYEDFDTDGDGVADSSAVRIPANSILIFDVELLDIK
jgi:FKBP-type peptidyl-prolyl cis-trans isomerase FkpA